MSKSDSIKFSYEIEDGYMGGARPQHMSVYAIDFDGCETDEQIIERAHELSYEHARQNLEVSLRSESEVVRKVRDALLQAEQE